MKKTIIKKMTLLITFIALFTIVLGISFSSKSQATDLPLAELYFYNHGDVGGLGAINTTTYKSSTESEIDSAGYNCYSYTNVKAGPSSSSSVIRTLDEDAVFFINAHAGQGRMALVDNSNNITRLTANTTSQSNGYSLQSNFQSTTDKLRKLKVAYWMGCHTYGTDSTYGSLNEKSNTLGIDCNITHDGTVWTPYNSYFLYRFAYYCDQGQTVGLSLTNARADTIAQYGTAAEVLETVDSYVISGSSSQPSNISVEPASFGVYY